MKRWLATWVLMVALPWSAMATNAPDPSASRKVLFIGNSITYTNNLPSAFAALVSGQRPGSTVSVDMYVKGAAALADFVRDESLRSALRDNHYTDVIVQERGGNAICAATSSSDIGEACRAVVKAHEAISRMVRRSGATVYYLGTYQQSDTANLLLVKGERRLADAMSARYIDIADGLTEVRQRHPDLPWIYDDGSHPGVATVGFMAAQIYVAVFGSKPGAQEICMTDPLYHPYTTFDGMVHIGQNDKPRPRQCLLSEAEMRTVLN
ncbi:lysophospholipase L1-like esterase [Luteibacter rhizovicinus]|uniref:Lysophospholipase L1-like esterase n=1 Tax=Luteibacter rhizovicinus TaxID=242606 RepID=A0A4R3YI04_9GAMM|nr:SGNH/GDSL hydrolase family protein [Luteibacter rhizovicinus]TCV91632.1 lysophospholipase L1-like esterase [Luteibacter rhizovicinus]